MRDLAPMIWVDEAQCIRSFDDPRYASTVIELKAERGPTRPVVSRCWIEPKPNVGPRGGDGDRAKTKAARKANLRRRRGG